MKVLVLTTAFAGWKDDRTSTFVYELSKRLKEEGFEIVVLAPHVEGAKRFEIMDELKVYRFSYFYPFKFQKIAYGNGIAYNIKNSYLAKIQAPLFFLSELLSVVKIVKREKIDVIHSHWLVPQGLVGAICKKIFKIPHISTTHGSDVYLIKKLKFFSIFSSFILHNSDKVTANSSYTKNIVLSIDDRVKNKVDVVPMGVDKNRFESEGTTNLKEAFEAEYLILSVGRLICLKGTKYLIIAMKEVIRKFPTAKLLIVGDGPEKEKLEKLAKELNLEDNVIFTGYIKNLDLPKYYSFADVFVTPTITIDGQAEGLGVVLLEAMACGTPVIGSNVGGIPDIIKDGYNGFLVPEKSPKDLADKIIELLSNKAIAEKFSANGSKTVRERFSWEIVTERFYKLYEEILEEER